MADDRANCREHENTIQFYKIEWVVPSQNQQLTPIMWQGLRNMAAEKLE